MDLPLQTAPMNGEDWRSGVTHIHQGNLQFESTQATSSSVFQGNFVGGITFNSTAARPDYVGHFSHSSLEPVKAFVPRPLFSDDIRRQLCVDATNESTKVLVVWGLGGVGKSQLVLDYVQRHRASYKATFWIEAGRKESLERDYVSLYQALYGVATDNGTVRVEDAVIAVKSWFSCRQGPWLMVLDGADTIENEQSSEYIDIKHYIPDVASLHVIITSRSSTAKDMARLDGIQVGEMEEGQAVELFRRYSQLSQSNADTEDEIKAIVKELGYLALAITLAATYVGRTRRLQSDIKGYLPEYKERRRELLSRKPESLIHQYSESVLTTWETSYKAMTDQLPEASALLMMLSFLSFDDIFLQLFGISNQVGSTVSIVDTVIAPWPTDIHQMEECFEMLERYSFIQWKRDQQSYAMHKLVHTWGHDRLSQKEQGKVGAAAFELVVAAVRACGKAPADRLRLVPHVMTSFSLFVGASGIYHWPTDGILEELGRVGRFLTDVGRYSEGRLIEEFVLEKSTHILSDGHLDTIKAMNNLAITLGELGQHQDAATMKMEVREKLRHILGDEHPDTISAMNNLAITLGELGQYQDAVTMKMKVREKLRHILGDEHPDTISAVNNLAITLGELGQHQDAATMKMEVREKLRHILGDEHPYTLSAMNNLANMLGELGQQQDAAAMLSKVLKKRRHILGDEHPDTIGTMNNLAVTLEKLGQHQDAAAMLSKVLKKRRHILGDEHPDTIGTMNNLAVTLEGLGQVYEAVEMLDITVRQMKLTLGDKHPYTKLALANLARCSAKISSKESPKVSGVVDQGEDIVREQ
ncbi:hypothetical protein N0V90_013194 [Kalmusia sp. IMI 367209]|nr:hypothetical protein N0V90_013194 [Kalmusia sp. IMI 367209]